MLHVGTKALALHERDKASFQCATKIGCLAHASS
jgi:hypothetical protein